jgi:hypothetical protein
MPRVAERRESMHVLVRVLVLVLADADAHEYEYEYEYALRCWRSLGAPTSAVIGEDERPADEQGQRRTRCTGIQLGNRDGVAVLALRVSVLIALRVRRIGGEPQRAGQDERNQE